MSALDIAGAVVWTPRELDERGRCCGRKPLVYKREAHRFCTRCCRSFHLTENRQIANWAWLVKDDGFTPRYPDHDYARLFGAGAG